MGCDSSANEFIAHLWMEPTPLRQQPDCEGLPSEAEQSVMRCLAKSIADCPINRHRGYQCRRHVRYSPSMLLPMFAILCPASGIILWPSWFQCHCRGRWERSRTAIFYTSDRPSSDCLPGIAHCVELLLLNGHSLFRVRHAQRLHNSQLPISLKSYAVWRIYL